MLNLHIKISTIQIKSRTGIKLSIESVRDYGLPQPLFEEGSHWFKVSLFFIKNQQSGITNQEMAIMALFETKEKLKSADVCQELNVRNARKINSSFTYVRRTCRGEPYVRPSYIGTKTLFVRGRT